MHDRFQEWREAGVFERMWKAGLEEYLIFRRYILVVSLPNVVEN